MIVQIGGKKGSGKDWLALQLKDAFIKRGHTVGITHAADKMKEMYSMATGISREDIEYLKNIDEPLTALGIQGKSVRQGLQDLGSYGRKVFGNDYWYKQLVIKVESMEEDIIIVPDFRYTIEKLWGASTMLVYNNDLVSKDTHESEAGLGDFKYDYHVDNTGKSTTEKDISNLVDFLIGGYDDK